MPTVTLRATISSEGRLLTNSNGIYVTKVDRGEYAISFSTPSKIAPSIVGSQINFGPNQDTRDNVIFPTLTEASALESDS